MKNEFYFLHLKNNLTATATAAAAAAAIMSLKIDISIVTSIFILCSVFFIVTQARNAKRGTCDPDREEYNSCGVLPSCEINCELRNTRACAKICSPGCFCIKPYIRRCENSTLCVTEEQCDE